MRRVIVLILFLCLISCQNNDKEESHRIDFTKTIEHIKQMDEYFESGIYNDVCFWYLLGRWHEKNNYISSNMFRVCKQEEKKLKQLYNQKFIYCFYTNLKNIKKK